MKLTRYQKEANYSYTIGVYPTLELINYHPEDIIRVVYSPAGTANQGLAKILDFCHRQNIPAFPDDKLVARLSDKDNAYVICLFNKYSPVLTSRQNHLVLVGPRDFGNLGTIIRTMVGFDFTNLVIIRPAADIFNPAVIRASMGAIFQINFSYFSSFSEYQSLFSDHHFYPLMVSAQQSLESTVFSPPASFIFGNESAGLDPEFTQVGTALKINQNHHIDSLNLASAVAITLHHFYSVTVTSLSHK